MMHSLILKFFGILLCSSDSTHQYLSNDMLYNMIEIKT